jgi:hypothetical protein
MTSGFFVAEVGSMFLAAALTGVWRWNARGVARPGAVAKTLCWRSRRFVS